MNDYAWQVIYPETGKLDSSTLKVALALNGEREGIKNLEIPKIGEGYLMIPYDGGAIVLFRSPSERVIATAGTAEGGIDLQLEGIEREATPTYPTYTGDVAYVRHGVKDPSVLAQSVLDRLAEEGVTIEDGPKSIDIVLGEDGKTIKVQVYRSGVADARVINERGGLDLRLKRLRLSEPST